MAKAKSPSGEATLPLGDEPVLDAAKAAEDAELAAMLAEEEAQALKPSTNTEPLTEATDLLPTPEQAAALAATGLATTLVDSPAQKPAHGPRVKVWPHGAVDWDAAHSDANLEFTVDTEKHTEEAFLGLLASGALIRLD